MLGAIIGDIVASRSKIPINVQPESFVGLTLKQAKMKLGIKN
jgi:hypothetical protein